MKVLGVTGGTGTGKSTVCRLLEKDGAVIIDADRIAKKTQEKGSSAYGEIVERFGSGILDEQGEIIRSALGKIVFNDRRKMKVLNGIVHKHVSEEIKSKVREYEEKGTELVVLDVPIPVEDGFFDTADRIWAVVANDDLRIERIMKRMGISEEEAELRIRAQMSNREYEEIADAVIYNEGSFEDLKKLVEYELRRYKEGL